MATYEVADLAFFKDERYTKLRANRSPREADLVARLETLDRRTAQLIGEIGSRSDWQNAPPVVMTLGFGDVTQQEWLRSDSLPQLDKVFGCKRATLWNIYDALIIGHGRQPASNVSPKTFMILGLLLSFYVLARSVDLTWLCPQNSTVQKPCWMTTSSTFSIASRTRTSLVRQSFALGSCIERKSTFQTT